jgi:hypothetical protein
MIPDFQGLSSGPGVTQVLLVVQSPGDATECRFLGPSRDSRNRAQKSGFTSEGLR